ncbi:hypothetical protein EJ02DRAFT_355802 [Clathrospora elynae]|uniref:Uncharacterized protein n=1 Tax=Clathrospora elynae TaxID=706981 RepID=A0A6A5SDQ4_9PLEO|nr:hypothetical protein EJ02DRAFT_355802 [Clathrospora elynae]
MLSSSHESWESEGDRLSVDIIPEQSLNMGVQSSCLHWLFGKDGGYVTCLEDHTSHTQPNSIEHAKTEAAIMNEVADWIQSQECDEFWAPRARQPRRMVLTANQLLVNLDGQHNNAEALETLLRVIALQLLASCYTSLPPTSANHMPLFHQQKERRPLTALRLHSQYRFSPAAGHQARAPSETAPWPDLYTGPTPEDKLAELASQKRRPRKHSSDQVPCFAASGWTDGPPLTEPRRDRLQSLCRSSSSESEPGFFSRLICQASLPKNPLRKHNTIFTSRLLSRSKKQKQSEPARKHSRLWERRTPLPSVTSEPAQRIPSAYRLRHTQSAPRFVLEQPAIEEAGPVSSAHKERRHSSNPSIGSPLSYAFDIPGIRRTSATPNATRRAHTPRTAPVRACGRGDLISDDTQSSYESSCNSTSYEHYPAHKGADSLNPSAIAPGETSSYGKPASDYFGELYTDKHVKHQTNDSDAAAEEHNDAGPELDDDPRLQKMLGGIVTQQDNDSRESYVGRTKKRKSITDSDIVTCQVAEQLKPQFDEKTVNDRKIWWVDLEFSSGERATHA